MGSVAAQLVFGALGLPNLWNKAWRQGQLAVQFSDHHLAAVLPEPGAIPEVIPLPSGLVVDGVPLQTEALGDLLGDLVLQQGWSIRQAALVLPSAGSEWRLLRLAGGQEPQPEHWQHLHQTLPQVADAYESELLPLPQPNEWLVLFQPKASLEGWIEVFAQADLELGFVELVELAQMRALGIGPEWPFSLLVNLRTDHTMLTLVQQGRPVFRRRSSSPQLSDPGAWCQELVALAEELRQQCGEAQPAQLLLMGAGLQQQGLADALCAAGGTDWKLAALADSAGLDPLTQASFAGLIGTARRIADDRASQG